MALSPGATPGVVGKLAEAHNEHLIKSCATQLRGPTPGQGSPGLTTALSTLPGLTHSPDRVEGGKCYCHDLSFAEEKQKHRET